MLLLVGNCSYLVYLFPFFSPPRVYLLIMDVAKARTQKKKNRGEGLFQKIVCGLSSGLVLGRLTI